MSPVDAEEQHRRKTDYHLLWTLRLIAIGVIAYAFIEVGVLASVALLIASGVAIAGVKRHLEPSEVLLE